MAYCSASVLIRHLVNDTEVLASLPAAHVGQFPALLGLNHSLPAGLAVSASSPNFSSGDSDQLYGWWVLGVVTRVLGCLQMLEALKVAASSSEGGHLSFASRPTPSFEMFGMERPKSQKLLEVIQEEKQGTQEVATLPVYESKNILQPLRATQEFDLIVEDVVRGLEGWAAKIDATSRSTE
ncbi:hypothetical protein HPG69_009721, partial [Diceros bicornis minor]